MTRQVPMEVIETKDFAIIDALTADSGLPPSHTWLHLGPWTILAAIEEGEPVAGAMLLVPGKIGLPEVHIIVPLKHRGPSTLVAFGLFKRWILENRPELDGVWAYTDDERTVRFARAMGFEAVDADPDETWMYFQLKETA